MVPAMPSDDTEVTVTLTKDDVRFLFELAAERVNAGYSNDTVNKARLVRHKLVEHLPAGVAPMSRPWSYADPSAETHQGASAEKLFDPAKHILVQCSSHRARHKVGEQIASGDYVDVFNEHTYVHYYIVDRKHEDAI
jgi:hypothetical protein